MECDQLLSAQTIDCEKHLSPTEVGLSAYEDLIDRHHFASVKHVQNDLLDIHISRSPDVALL